MHQCLSRSHSQLPAIINGVKLLPFFFFFGLFSLFVLLHCVMVKKKTFFSTWISHWGDWHTRCCDLTARNYCKNLCTALIKEQTVFKLSHQCISGPTNPCSWDSGHISAAYILAKTKVKGDSFSGNVSMPGGAWRGAAACHFCCLHVHSCAKEWKKCQNLEQRRGGDSDIVGWFGGRL